MNSAAQISTPQLSSSIARQALVVGIGVTGLSCARFLIRLGYQVKMVDSRQNPPCLKSVMVLGNELKIHTGSFKTPWFAQLGKDDLLVVSPGVPRNHTAFSVASQNGVQIVGDVELFARQVDVPVIAITGSNGKSTVTSLVGEMCRAAGIKTAVGGNLGDPILDIMDDHSTELYVVELSSFQLETTQSLNAEVAVVLNVSPDHLDRYDSFKYYADAKAGIYKNARCAVVNRDDKHVRAMVADSDSMWSFGFSVTTHHRDFGVFQDRHTNWVTQGAKKLLDERQLRIRGGHNLLNVAAACAIFSAAGYELSDAVLESIQNFSGLPHRSEWIGSSEGVDWINDSKGTNVGATVAALQGMDTKVVLIAGGQGKGADFSPLHDAVARHAKAVVLIGEDAELIDKALAGIVPVVYANGLAEAVEIAARLATTGDSVLFSPACASFDMFKNFAQRGEKFVALVRERLK